MKDYGPFMKYSTRFMKSTGLLLQYLSSCKEKNMLRNSFLYLSLVVFFFACQVDDLEDGIPLQQMDEESIFDATYIADANARVVQSDGLKVQIARKGNPANSQTSFRFLIDQNAFPGVSSVEIISLEGGNTKDTPNFTNPLIASKNNGKGNTINLVSADVFSKLVTNVSLGFSLLDANGDYLEDGFFDLHIHGEGGKKPVITFNKSEQTEFDVILSSAGAEKLKVIQVLQTELGIAEKEAINLIEKTPIVILSRASKEEANQLKAALEAVGATVDLK